MRPDDERYFARIEDRLDEALALAETAKGQGYDPEPEVEIPVARDMADRVENILGIDGVAERVRELEGEMSREEAALALVTDFVEGTVGDYDSRAGKVEGAVRTAVALLTEGVVAAPIEGIDRVELLENDDGTEFVNVYYAGPIRSAGGTAQALSVLVADYARSLLGIDEYKPRDVEVERYAEEIALYDKETGLQYTPKDKESKFIAEHIPVMLDGEATGDEEVSGFRDLERVGTNSARGGMCLVAAEGIALKAPKIQRYTRDLDEVDWPWLQDLIDGTIGKDGSGESDAAGSEGESPDSEGDAGDDASEGDERESASGGDKPAGPPRAKPSQKFLRDLIAGRPVFTHPSEAGGFRLRYGRARNHGFATGGVHPATMHLVDDFLAAGTQIKTERPGKAHGVVPVDSIEGPTVRLANGEVRRIDDPEEAKAVRNGVEKVLDLGEYLVNYGEFVENNHPLAPASYVYEWWVKEFADAGADVQALRDDPHVDLEHPDVDEALAWAREYDCPLHPEYTSLWHDVSVAAFEALAEAVADGDVVEGVLAIERTETTQAALESLLVEHTATPDALRVPTWRPLARSLGVDDGLRKTWGESDLSAAARNWADGENAVKAVNEVAPFEVRERAPTRIGNRMGRPEKSESRDLSPAVHTLFPINEAGGPQRDVAEAASVMDDSGHRGRLEVEVSDRLCPDCGEHTYTARCPDCGVHTEPHYECNDCGTVCEPDEAGRVECPRCEWEVRAATYQEVDLNDAYRSALANVGEREASFEILKGVQGLTSRNKTPEPIEKGVLRAKNGVTSFKDGTVRYDMTDLPVTSVRPEELDVTADHLREIGYETDIDGEPLRHDDQLVELRVQDIVLSDGAAEHMLRTADFVDDDFVETYLDQSEVAFDDFGTAIGELEGVDGGLSVPAVTADGERVSRPVEAVSKHEAPDHMIQIRTVSGRSITVTPDHGVHVYDGEQDEIVSREARDLDTTDKLVIPDSIESSETTRSQQQFDLLAEFIRSDAVPTDRLMIKGLDKDRLYELFEDTFADDWEGQFYPLKSMTEVFDTNKKTLSNYLYRESFPASYLQRCFSSIDDLLAFVPDDVTLGMKRDRTEIDRVVELDQRVATLLGYYAAEGFAREQETPKGTIHQTTVCGTEAEAREFFLDVLRDEFGVEPYEENHAKVTVSGRLLRAFFDSVLDAGVYAETKRVPNQIFDAPEAIVGAYLSGYFSGDGGVHKGSLRVTATTVSEELREDLLALLRRLNIRATVDRPTRVLLQQKFPEFYDESDMRLTSQTYVIAVSSQDAVRFSEIAGFHLSRKDNRLTENVSAVDPYGSTVSDGGSGAYSIENVDQVEIVESDSDHVYCLTVEDTHSLIANDLSVDQCDGDEDCVMLLMDGLLNFSKEFLPDQRGGRMDAPIVREYPREFYEATLDLTDPEELEDRIQLGEDTLGTDEEYHGFDHTHDTTDIAMGPDLSAYKTLGDMMEKMDAQLALARKIRAVDETDVAERVIEYHFLPDIIGNLRAFSRQETRCLDCGEKYRRMPLTGDCRECGGRVNLTVHQGSVNKYVDTAIEVADRFGCRPYTKQRLKVLEESLESIFEDDTNKQSGIADFM